MTPVHALDYIRGVEIHFRKEFVYDELNAVWPRILVCDTRAGGKAMNLAKNHKKMVGAIQFAQMVEKQDVLLKLGAEAPVVAPEQACVKMPGWFKARMRELGVM